MKHHQIQILIKMKMSIGQLKQIIREDHLKGIPTFMIKQAADECIDKLRQHMIRSINQRSTNQSQQREMLDISNVVLEELREELYQKLEDKLLQFMYQI